MRFWDGSGIQVISPSILKFDAMIFLCSRPPLAENLSSVLAGMAEVEARVRMEAEAGNSFGRVASGEALVLAAAAAQVLILGAGCCKMVPVLTRVVRVQGKGDSEEQDEPSEPLDPGADLTR